VVLALDERSSGAEADRGIADTSLSRVTVERLAEGKALRRALGIDRATDILSTVNRPGVWQLPYGRAPLDAGAVRAAAW
jgi:hypothetical protein